MINSNTFIWLDLSNNSLTDMTGFNLDAIPSLTTLNVSDNALEYLPRDFVDKLEETNDFYVIIDNNPWNCSHPEWKDYLSTQLTQAFCSNISSLSDSYKSSEVSKQNTNITTDLSSNCAVLMLKNRCAFWIFGALWVGIILGNISKLKQLLFCPKSQTLKDKATQCGKYTI